MDTSDHFRTPIDYIAAAQQAGFFVYTFIYDHRTLNLLRRPSLAVSRRDFGLQCYYPWGATGRYDRLLLLGTKNPLSSRLTRRGVHRCPYSTKAQHYCCNRLPVGSRR